MVIKREKRNHWAVELARKVHICEAKITKCLQKNKFIYAVGQHKYFDEANEEERQQTGMGETVNEEGDQSTEEKSTPSCIKYVHTVYVQFIFLIVQIGQAILIKMKRSPEISKLKVMQVK